MTDHINNFIVIFPSKQSGFEKVSEILARTDGRKITETSWWFADIFVDGSKENPTREQVATAEWNIENIGSEHAVIVHYSQHDNIQISIFSSDTPVSKGAEKLARVIASADDHVILMHQYDSDEANLWGAHVYGGKSYHAGREGTILPKFFADRPALAATWDAARNDWVRDENGDLPEEAKEAKAILEEDGLAFIDEHQTAAFKACMPKWRQV
jgi:hypothetical protein